MKKFYAKYGLIECTTDRQRKNGTIAFEDTHLQTSRFCEYNRGYPSKHCDPIIYTFNPKSGYMRRISGKNPNWYPINRTKKSFRMLTHEHYQSARNIADNSVLNLSPSYKERTQKQRYAWRDNYNDAMTSICDALGAKCGEFNQDNTCYLKFYNLAEQMIEALGPIMHHRALGKSKTNRYSYLHYNRIETNGI